MKKTIGFIGQGWIGKNYADDFERRGFSVVRFSLDPEYKAHEAKIAECDIVFIAVPTPTTPQGFDDSIVRDVMKYVGRGKTAVIKSTMLPGTTESIQKENPQIAVFHSPEFLTEANAAYDAAHPRRNIIGIPADTEENRRRAEEVLVVLPKAPFEKICCSRDAEIIKYAGNSFLFLKVVYANVLYDLTEGLGGDWDAVRDSLAADPRIGSSHLKPVDTDGGRGAGGHCFIKDFKAFADFYKENLPDDSAACDFLEAAENKNNELLISSGKDLELLEQVYGKEVADIYAESR